MVPVACLPVHSLNLPIRRVGCLLLALVLGFLCGCGSSTDEVRDPEIDLYLEIFAAYEPLSECVRKKIEDGSLQTDSWLAWLAASDDRYEAFVFEATRLLEEEKVGEFADAFPTRESRLAVLATGLGVFGAANRDSDDGRMRLKRISAIVLTFSSMAESTGGACIVSDELKYWMAQARDAGI